MLDIKFTLNLISAFIDAVNTTINGEIPILNIEKYKKGNKIHIKKENRGKFTKSAKRAGETVLQHAHSVLNNPNSTKLQRKRAQFAINASKWK